MLAQQFSFEHLICSFITFFVTVATLLFAQHSSAIQSIGIYTLGCLACDFFEPSGTIATSRANSKLISLSPLLWSPLKHLAHLVLISSWPTLIAQT
jgi:hypothetical protein